MLIESSQLGERPRAPWQPPVSHLDEDQYLAEATDMELDAILQHDNPPDATTAPTDTTEDMATSTVQVVPAVAATVASDGPQDAVPAQPQLDPTATGNNDDGSDSDPESPPGFSRAEAWEAEKLEAFTKEVQRKIRSPLAPRPSKTKRVAPAVTAGERRELPNLANHPLANVASSKRAEVVLMRRFSVVPEAAPITSDGKAAYKKLYSAGKADTSPILGMQA